jgi:hypothetical protein
MWRASMSVIHIDGSVSKEEETWALSKISNLPFNEDQKETLRKDLANGPDICALLPLITHRPDMAFLLHLVRTVGHLDGVYNEGEKKLFSKLEKTILEGLDLSALESQIKNMEENSYLPKGVKTAEEFSKRTVYEKAVLTFKWWLDL